MDQRLHHAARTNGVDNARWWVKSCLVDTKQGEHVADAIDILKRIAVPALQPHFLYGNHDNYLGDPKTASVDYSTPKNPKRWLDPRQPNYATVGLWMEHGHQREAANADNAEILPFTRLLSGTNCPLGLFTTQAAFFRPRPMRQFDDAAQAALAQVTTPNAMSGSVDRYPQRLKQVAYAADLAVGGKDGIYCYVMGHTHTPCLARVFVYPNDLEDRAHEVIRRINARTAKLTLSRVDTPREMGGPGMLKLEYGGLLADVGRDWISIDDPLWAPGDRRHGLWEYVGKPSGESTYVVPPGRYEARYDPELEVDSPIPRSEVVTVKGLSFEPPIRNQDTNPDLVTDASGAIRQYDQVDPATYAYRSVTDVDPIYLRWALPPGVDNLGPDRFVLVLLREEDLAAATDGRKVMDLTGKNRWTDLSRIVPHATHDFGRWRLNQDFTSFAAQRAKESKDGSASFTIAIVWHEVVDDDKKWGLLAQASFTLVAVHPKKKKPK